LNDMRPSCPLTEISTATLAPSERILPGHLNGHVCTQAKSARLDEELDTAADADIDASPNGLQVGRADKSVDPGLRSQPGPLSELQGIFVATV
jgi:hypothetical protein